MQTTDSCRTWTSDATAPTGLVVLRWADDALWAGTDDGALCRADPATGGWSQVHAFGGAVEALFAEGDDLYVAAEPGGILHSPDGGRTWRQPNRPDS